MSFSSILPTISTRMRLINENLVSCLYLCCSWIVNFCWHGIACSKLDISKDNWRLSDSVAISRWRSSENQTTTTTKTAREKKAESNENCEIRWNTQHTHSCNGAIVSFAVYYSVRHKFCVKMRIVSIKWIEILLDERIRWNLICFKAWIW